MRLVMLCFFLIATTVHAFPASPDEACDMIEAEFGEASSRFDKGCEFIFRQNGAYGRADLGVYPMLGAKNGFYIEALIENPGALDDESSVSLARTARRLGVIAGVSPSDEFLGWIADPKSVFGHTEEVSENGMTKVAVVTTNTPAGVLRRVVFVDGKSRVGRGRGLKCRSECSRKLGAMTEE